VRAVDVYDEALRLAKSGWPLVCIIDEMERRIAEDSAPGTLRRMELDIGLNTALDFLVGWLHGYLDKKKTCRHCDLKAYLGGYQNGVRERRKGSNEAMALCDSLTGKKPGVGFENAQALKRIREQFSKMVPARGQGGPGVQLRLIEGGKKGAK